jgi:NADPH-dependent 2,4-dienoyl-CoA reductase/sulfur reductase-like enzyme
MQFVSSFGQKMVSNCDPTCTKIYDVIVVGGGPAGIGAALVAAELGAKTILVERDYRVGGTTVQASCMGMGQAAGAVRHYLLSANAIRVKYLLIWCASV